MPDSTAFASLALKPELLGNLADLGFTQMTLVQSRALPALIAGADVLARAKTGSGKTAAFGLGLLNRLDTAVFQVQALVLCPTRELADQVAREIRRLARAVPNVKILTLCGGAPYGSQAASLKRSAHIVVGTPGRVLKHLGKATLDIKGLRALVLDEADRMLDMGFADELDAILGFVPARRQTLLFSATYPPEIADISTRVQSNPLIVDVTDDELPANIRQYWCEVTRESRSRELLRAVRAWGGDLNLVFCNTKIDCIALWKYLGAQGIAAVELHGDLDQAQRTQALVRFANRSATVMVATDVAARGLDVSDLAAVFNYELPSQADVYIHRIGRTGRAGKAGVAVSLVEPREIRRLLTIEAVLPDGTLTRHEIPATNRSADCLVPEMTTIQINGGRKNKLRPGDLLGALTAKGGVPGDAVGSIDLFDNHCYVAVRRSLGRQALAQLADTPVKGKRFRARISQ